MYMTELSPGQMNYNREDAEYQGRYEELSYCLYGGLESRGKCWTLQYLDDFVDFHSTLLPANRRSSQPDRTDQGDLG
jgi:hypothetical protein